MKKAGYFTVPENGYEEIISLGFVPKVVLIEYVAKEGKNVVKVSRRDIPVVVANKLDGATTVAATMYIASLAGVKVFATGGIGGVHRGAEVSMDISADLDELGSTNVAVVCAGAKAILDLEKTLEYLEHLEHLTF